jgi:hypothetical protein
MCAEFKEVAFTNPSATHLLLSTNHERQSTIHDDHGWIGERPSYELFTFPRCPKSAVSLVQIF